MPSPSRSHCTTAPAMKIAPSSAYVVFPFIVHATVESNRLYEGSAFSPVFVSRNAPVPNVALARCVSTQSWPARADCWSPIIEAILTPSTIGTVDSAISPAESTTSGSIDRYREQFEQLVVPRHLRDVEEHRP